MRATTRYVASTRSGGPMQFAQQLGHCTPTGTASVTGWGGPCIIGGGGPV